MSDRNPYDVLGVKPGSTQKELRSAWIKRTKVLHPDRFDKEKQPVEWQMANDMLQELNDAYNRLKSDTEQPYSGHTAYHDSPQDNVDSRPSPPPPVTPNAPASEVGTKYRWYRSSILVGLLIGIPVLFGRELLVGSEVSAFLQFLAFVGMIVMGTGPVFYKHNGNATVVPPACRWAVILILIVLWGWTTSSDNDTDVNAPDNSPETAPVASGPTTANGEVLVFTERTPVDELDQTANQIAASGRFGPMPSDQERKAASMALASGDDEAVAKDIVHRTRTTLWESWLAAINQYVAQGKVIQMPPGSSFQILKVNADKQDSWAQVRILGGSHDGAVGYCAYDNGFLDLTANMRTALSRQIGPYDDSTETFISDFEQAEQQEKDFANDLLQARDALSNSKIDDAAKVMTEASQIKPNDQRLVDLKMQFNNARFKQVAESFQDSVQTGNITDALSELQAAKELPARHGVASQATIDRANYSAGVSTSQNSAAMVTDPSGVGFGSSLPPNLLINSSSK